MATFVDLSPSERRLCAITQDGVLLYDTAKKGELAIFEVRRRLEHALGRTAETRPVAILEIDRINSAGDKPVLPPVRGHSEIEDLSRRILDDAALLEASDIHLSVDHRTSLGQVTLRVRGKLTHPVHELRSDDCHRLLNLVFARLDEGPQTLRENRSQSGAILQPDKLPIGVGGARIQTVWPGNGFHLNIRLRYSQSALGLASLSDLGLPEAVVTDLRYMSTASRGLVLVSGPTESGKSTMLATLTREIFDAAGGLLTIASAEDPVEEWHEHLLQIPVNTDELGDDAWIEAQKLFTRIAPDIGQVGEIRTGEAAERAYSFADTGKLTLATIHVSSALDIPFRLMSGLGISASRALDPVQNPAWTSQRLVPLLCRSCCIPETGDDGPVHPARDAVRRRFLASGFDLSEARRRGPGCPACDPRAATGLSRGGTPGLAGRQLVLEVVLPDGDLVRRLGTGDRAGARTCWIRSGGLPLSVQTWDLVCQGRVDIGDYRHHVGGPEDLARDLSDCGARPGRQPFIRVAGIEPLLFAPPFEPAPEQPRRGPEQTGPRSAAGQRRVTPGHHNSHPGTEDPDARALPEPVSGARRTTGMRTSEGRRGTAADAGSAEGGCAPSEPVTVPEPDIPDAAPGRAARPGSARSGAALPKQDAGQTGVPDTGPPGCEPPGADGAASDSPPPGRARGNRGTPDRQEPSTKTPASRGPGPTDSAEPRARKRTASGSRSSGRKRAGTKSADATPAATGASGSDASGSDASDPKAPVPARRKDTAAGVARSSTPVSARPASRGRAEETRPPGGGSSGTAPSGDGARNQVPPVTELPDRHAPPPPSPSAATPAATGRKGRTRSGPRGSARKATAAPEPGPADPGSPPSARKAAASTLHDGTSPDGVPGDGLPPGWAPSGKAPPEGDRSDGIQTDGAPFRGASSSPVRPPSTHRPSALTAQDGTGSTSDRVGESPMPGQDIEAHLARAPAATAGSPSAPDRQAGKDGRSFLSFRGLSALRRWAFPTIRPVRAGPEGGS